MKKILLTPLAAICLYWSGAALSADFVVVRIEAENFTSKSDRWVLTSPDSIPTITPDPDPPHNDNASGRANLELLPDSRVTHQDEVANGGMDGNFWGGPGGGPRIDYNIEVPEPGRYFVYVKTFSTGTEDNGLHVGINNTQPESGKRIQICSKHNWFWTSGQRTNDNHCGVTKTIWLDVLQAGTNTITFFAREDGFEIDQFLLLKETHDGSLDCFPTFNDKIRCRDVATGATISDTEVPFSQSVGGNTVTNPTPQQTAVDLDIDINPVGSSHFVEDTIEYRVKVTNKDDQNMATGTVATINLPAGLQYAGSSVCSENASTVSCDFNNMAADSNDTVSFFAQVLTDGDHRVDAQVRAEQNDTTSSNNTDSATITAAFSIPDYEASIALRQSSNVSTAGGQNLYIASVTNNGLQEIRDAVLQISLGSGLSMDPYLEGCSSNCEVPVLAPGETVEMNFYTVATAAGVYSVNADVAVNNDADLTNNNVALKETVVDSAIATGDNGEITIEAESFSFQSPASTTAAPKWFLITPSFTPLATTLDPDQASANGVSGSAYMEILPDARIDANGNRVEGITNFDEGGIGATMSYNIFFYEGGTYYVHARVRPNNTEDATLHVGLNNEWPTTSASLSVCNPDGTWQWTGNVKTNDGCSVESAASITIDGPGMHVLMLSQDTDGLEIDKIVLSKSQTPDLNGNGPTPKTFSLGTAADVSMSTSISTDTAKTDEEVELVVVLANNSSTQDTVGLTITIDGLTNIDADVQPTVFDSCSASEFGTVCSLARLNANEEVTETFKFSSSEAKTLSIQSTVTAAMADGNSQNNSDEVTLTVSKKGSGGGALSLWFLMILLLPLGRSLTTTRQLARLKAQPSTNRNFK